MNANNFLVTCLMSRVEHLEEQVNSWVLPEDIDYSALDEIDNCETWIKQICQIQKQEEKQA